MLKRILVMLLVLVMCAGVFVGCTTSGENEVTDTDTVATENPDENGDGIGNYNFEGATFNILTRSSTDYEHLGSLGSDSVSQKVYERNKAVEERFNVVINVESIKGDWDKKDEFITAVRSENMAPTGAYDLISTHSVYLGWLGVEGVAHDLATLPEIDLTADYWNQNTYEQLNIDGKCYMMVGDIGHTLYEYIFVLFVNTKLIENNQLVDGGVDGLYNMVDEGVWTWDALYQTSKNFGLGAENPTYGLLFNAHALRASLMSQDAYIYERDQDNRLYMPNAASEKVVKAVENLSRFFAQDNMYYAPGWGAAENESNALFTTNAGLFYAQQLGQAVNLQSMGDSYAVLPLPKFDEFQDDYYTICRDTVTGIMVMNCAKNLEMSGVITQALCMYGQQIVVPEYYEKILKYRYNSDPRSVEILDKIRDSLTYMPVGSFYDTGIDLDMFVDIVRNGENEGIAGKYAEYVSRGNAELQTFYERIALLEE